MRHLCLSVTLVRGMVILIIAMATTFLDIMRRSITIDSVSR